MAFVLPIAKVIGTVLTAGSVVSSVVSGYSAAKNSEAEYRSQQKAHEYNAQVNRENARLAMRSGMLQSSYASLDAYKDQGRLRAAMAQSGISGSETAQGLMADSKQNAKDDQWAIYSNAYNQSKGYLSQANLQDMYATNAGNNASVTGKGAVWGAVTSGLGGASTIYDKWQSFSK